jgi:hypothetical protein
VVAAVCVLVALASAAAARAQASAPHVQFQVDSETVGVGDTFVLRMIITSSDEAPAGAQLGSTPGFVVRGESTSPSQTHMIVNGVRSDQYSLTVDWTLQAQRAGTFSIGPPIAILGSGRYTSQKVTLHVVPAGQAPRRAPPRQRPDPFGSPFSPFGPFGGLFPGMDDSQQAPPSTPEVTTDPKLAVDAPPGSYFFLRATVDKTAAVAGEQITFTVYEYADPNAGDIAVDDDIYGPQAPDFIKHPLVDEDKESPLAGYASVGGRIWIVKIAHRWALFPLHAGELAITPMTVTMTRPRAIAGQKRSSESLVIRVVDAPLAGRPPGYSPGDVGRFTLSAQVQPREVEQGGAVSVHVEIAGTGNVPAAIAPPVREGVEWLTPEVHEQLGASGQGSVYGGKRTFDYVVHVTRAGAVDLGDVSLPFWDPEQRKYGVARAALGLVQVKAVAGAAANAKADPAVERLTGLPSPRDALEGGRAVKAHWDDSPFFWLVGVAGAPLAFGTAVVGRGASRRMRAAWHARRTSPAADLKERVVAMRTACERGDPQTIDATVTRALEAATVAHANVGIRGALGAEVVGRLERAGVEPGVAETISTLLGECERSRFAPQGFDVDASRSRAARALDAIGHLEKRA